jgi:hypothetical protein
MDTTLKKILPLAQRGAIQDWIRVVLEIFQHNVRLVFVDATSDLEEKIESNLETFSVEGVR